MIQLLLLLPFILSIPVILIKNRIINITAHVIYAVTFLTASIELYIHPATFTEYFSVDGINVLFLLIMAFLYFIITIYNIHYIWHDKENRTRQSLYTVNILLFIASMTGVILSTHLAELWVFIEATTLTSAYLIYYNRSATAVEATWKYLFICSIGIAIAFIGITFLSMGLGDYHSLFFSDLYANAKNFNPFWLKFAFPFILIGFGTKVGFAPVHSWLPDAHSESPSPVSALLSGTLLNVALLGILRVSKIMTAADLGWYVKVLLILFGFLSIFITAVYMRIVKNYKRMLAYSSIENMGIIAIGIGIGGAGVFAAMLHLIAHSLTKASLFLTSGNILHRYNSRDISSVKGILQADSKTGWLWILSFTAIIGIPPFPIFISEFFIVKTMFQQGYIILAILFLLLLTIIMGGMAKNIFAMSFGHDSSKSISTGATILTWLPQSIFLISLVIIGIALPPILKNILNIAAANL